MLRVQKVTLYQIRISQNFVHKCVTDAAVHWFYSDSERLEVIYFSLQSRLGVLISISASQSKSSQGLKNVGLTDKKFSLPAFLYRTVTSFTLSCLADKSYKNFLKGSDCWKAPENAPWYVLHKRQNQGHSLLKKLKI